MTLHPKQQIGSSINRFLNSIEEEKTTQNEFRSKQKEIRQQFCFQPKKKIKYVGISSKSFNKIIAIVFLPEQKYVMNKFPPSHNI